MTFYSGLYGEKEVIIEIFSEIEKSEDRLAREARREKEEKILWRDEMRSL